MEERENRVREWFSMWLRQDCTWAGDTVLPGGSLCGELGAGISWRRSDPAVV